MLKTEVFIWFTVNCLYFLKKKKRKYVFFIFSGVRERDQWHEMSQWKIPQFIKNVFCKRGKEKDNGLWIDHCS